VPAVERQGQRPPYAGIVERLPLVVRGDDQRAVPVALLYRDLFAERAEQLVDRRRRKAAEFDGCAVAADGFDPHRLLVGIDAGDPIEIGQTLMIVIRVTFALDRLTCLVVDELERAGAHDVLLVPAGILVEDFLLVDPSEGTDAG
jgi:hypothetical protein